MTGAGDHPDEGHDAAASAKLEERLDLALQAFALKDVDRAGWVLRGIRDPESVAAHSWGTALLCLLFAEEAGVDAHRAVSIALVHDLAEAVTGDLVARADPADRDVSEGAKAAQEAAAIATLLPTAAHELAAIRRLWQDYEDRTDPAAVFVRDMNLIDMCLQASIYERDQRYDSTHLVPSRGGFVHLDEFFASAEQRLEGQVAKRLFAMAHARYLRTRPGSGS